MKKSIIVIHLNLGKDLLKIKKKFNSYNKIHPHISLVYPFSVANKKDLEKHIQIAISKIKPFNLVMGGLQKSAKEFFLYLNIKRGKQQVIQLHKNLNSNILKNFKNPAMPKYIPHLTLGVFNDKKEINDAINSLEKKKILFSQKITKIDLVTFSPRRVKSFKLT